MELASDQLTKIELLLINQATRGHSLHQQKINVLLDCSDKSQPKMPLAMHPLKSAHCNRGASPHWPCHFQWYLQTDNAWLMHVYLLDCQTAPSILLATRQILIAHSQALNLYGNFVGGK